MSITNKRIADLLIRNLEKELEAHEQAELQEWMQQSGLHEQIVREFTNTEAMRENISALLSKETAWQRVYKTIHKDKVIEMRPKEKIKRWAIAAACIILLTGLGVYFLFLQSGKHQPDTVKVKEKQDVSAPVANRAMITLTDGRMISLDSVSSGLLAKQSDVIVTKAADGQIIYAGKTSETGYNTLANPKGSKAIDMTLADGSRVWLNAGSSVTYPVSFTDNERKVKITGEAYFEITHNATRPFIVSKGNMEVHVLGTKFNVNAYDDESDIKVTLLEGSVKINKGSHASMLKPEQQAQIARDIRVISHVDVEQVMAWKNGLFSFSGANIKEVMLQLSRWYDLDVSYAGAVPDGQFKGEIPRNLSLSQVLNILTTTRIHYKMEEPNKIIIMPD